MTIPQAPLNLDSSRPKSFAFLSVSAENTKDAAKELALFLRAGDVISLTGELGAGKTTFVQGLATGLGCRDLPTSPTFTILHEYDCDLPLYHFDAYRLSGPRDLERLGYEDYFFGNGIAVIEWGKKIEALLPREALTVDFSYGEGRDDRLLRFSAVAGHFTAELGDYRDILARKRLLNE